MEAGRHGSGEAGMHGTLELLNPGTLEPGTLEPWNSGTLEPWNLGTLEPWNPEPGTLASCRLIIAQGRNCTIDLGQEGHQNQRCT
jgi:hypothetical protein